MNMNQQEWRDALLHTNTCSMCRGSLESIGPVHGPVLAPKPRVNRWSMSKEEWYGQT